MDVSPGMESSTANAHATHRQQTRSNCRNVASPRRCVFMTYITVWVPAFRSFYVQTALCCSHDSAIQQGARIDIKSQRKRWRKFEHPLPASRKASQTCHLDWRYGRQKETSS